MITKKQEIVKMIDEVSNLCDIFQLQGHITLNCQTLTVFKEILNEYGKPLTQFLNQ